ncbi:MAG: hypothetical protein JSV56_06460, partial [Methanomassiliicoccales archaeon]
MVNEGINRPSNINPKDIEDAEVLTKSAEIDIIEAEKTGADLSEAKHYLEEAKTHLENLNTKQVRISVKKAKAAAADAKRYHRSKLLIQHALPVVADARRAGADATKAESYLDKAKEALRNKAYGDLSEYVRTAKREAKEAKRYHRAYLMIENCRTDISNAKEAGADVTVAEAYYDQALMALQNKDYGVVSQSVKEAKKAAVKFQKHKKVEELIEEVKPEIDEIKRFGLKTEEIEDVVEQAEEALARRDYAEVRSLVRKIKRRVKKAMERKGTDVLLATIEHVIHRGRAKGKDVSRAEKLLERAKNALETMNYAEIERVISEINYVAKSMDLVVGGLAENLFSKAKLVDLDKIDMVFSEAERKISAEMARARMTAMKDLMALTKELRIEKEEFVSLLQKAEEAFETKQFDIIEEYKEEFEEKLEEAKLKHKTEFVAVRIKKALELIVRFKELGIDVERAEELLFDAEKQFKSQEFEKAEKNVDEAEKIANNLRRRHDTEQDLESTQEILSEANALGVDSSEANDLLKEAQDELSMSNFGRATELIEEARNITTSNVQQFIHGKYPKFELDLPKGGMEVDVWNKCVIEIANIGDLIAKNVDIAFRGDVDVKGIETIEKLNVGEKKRMEIGVKPREAGEVSLDVQLAYQRAFDDTLYQLNIAKRLIADSRGTYQLEEVLLIHNNGVLISQVSRIMDIDIDRDIFSGMFTAVQEFIKDSFGRSEDTGLTRMDFGEKKILIEHGHTIFLTSILGEGEPRYLPLYMVEVLREVEEKYGDVLDGWQGNYSQLEGIDDIVKKLLNVTDEKGAEVEGFESGVVASTIKLVEAARNEGLKIGEQEMFIEEFMQAMENEGFERAWAYLVDKGKQVNFEMKSASAKEKLIAMRDLVNSAKELGVDEAGLLNLVDMAESAFESEEFESIEEYKNALEKNLEEARIKYKIDIIESRIKNAKATINRFKEIGVDVDKPEELLALAEREFEEKDFQSVLKHVDEAEKLAYKLRQRHEIEEELESARQFISEAQALGVDPKEAIDLLTHAEEELRDNNFTGTKEFIKRARDFTMDTVQQFIKGKSPKFILSLPEGGMEADVWNKSIIKISNIGNLSARNVDITIRGNVDVKGLERIKKLDLEEKWRMEIGIKPMEAGELPLDVQLTYQRAFDETLYQLNIPKKLTADPSGTYQLEEVLLIHNSGVLVSHVSRKLEEDIDRDIFSGMFTAVQEFIKDSFGTSQDTGLTRMDFGEKKILIEHGRSIFLTSILGGGEPRYLPLYMVEILREVEEEYGDTLEGWQGNYSQLEGIDDIVRKLLNVTDEKGADVEGFESGVVA